ncbi:MAG: hypothetical protein ACU83O_05865 [Gammaproteobacteria bacterium]
MRNFVSRAVGVLTLSYPLAVYFGTHYLEPRQIALILAISLFGRLLNGMATAATAVWSSFGFWALYNGLAAYVLIGLLMADEYWVRIRTQDYAR